jgi:hypothetical protein
VINELEDGFEFDHIDPATKLFQPGTKREGAWVKEELFWEEVDKCQLLCQECHRKKTSKEQQGASNSNAKLTEQNVYDIRRLYEAGYSQRGLSRDFGVSRATIQDIVHGKSWLGQA